LAGCLDFNDCTEGEGEVVGRFLYVVDESGTEADLHSVDVRGDVMYAVGDAGTLLTGTPDDVVWTAREAGTEADLVGVATLDGTIAVVIGGDGTVLRTEDAGETWTAVDAGLPAGAEPSAVTTVGAEGFVIVGDGLGVWSEDAGVSWSAAEGLDGTGLNDVAVIKESRLLAVGDAGVVAESKDGGATWEVDAVDDEFSQLDLRGVSFRGGGEGRIITNSGRVLATDNSGLSWTSDGVVAGAGHAVALVSTETWVAAEGNAVFYRYRTDPAYVERVLTVGAERFYDVRVNPYGDAIFVGEKGVILRGRLEYTQIPQYCYGS
jgi:photosystem II stability/assembly factor-like uncharacterized protein